MKHFVNKDFLAANVMTVPVDLGIVAEFKRLHHERGRGFASISPAWKSDIEWLSPVTEEGHAIFESAFERLGIADRMLPYLEVDREVRLYAGFLVIRSTCREPHFHVDWVKTNNQAFTLLTPIVAPGTDVGLLYRKMTGEVAEYRYKTGEAIIFGDHFWHSSKPGHSPDPVILLCFEFGTDRMEDWERIHATIGHQAQMLRRPDGQFMFTKLGSGSGY